MGTSAAIEDVSGQWEGRAQLVFIFGTGALIGAAVLTVVVLSALHERHGGLGLVGYAGIGLAALGTAACFVSWFVFGWAGLIGAGILLISAAMWHRGLAPRWPTMVFGGSWAVAWLTGVGLRFFEVGPRDEWGDYPVAFAAMIGTGAVLVAVGLVGIGRWLATEELEPVPAVVLP